MTTSHFLLIQFTQLRSDFLFFAHMQHYGNHRLGIIFALLDKRVAAHSYWKAFETVKQYTSNLNWSALMQTKEAKRVSIYTRSKHILNAFTGKQDTLVSYSKSRKNFAARSIGVLLHGTWFMSVRHILILIKRLLITFSTVEQDKINTPVCA